MDGLASSIVDWWTEAGVDSFVDEAPRDWLAPPRTTAGDANVPAMFREGDANTPATLRAGPGMPAPAAVILPAGPPNTLAEFRAWLLSDPAVPGRPAARLDAQGAPGREAGGVMILVDMPETDDRASRRLLAGDAGALLDRMIEAIGLSRDTVYLAAFSPARPASGSLDPATIAALQPIARHHLALVAPAKLLVMGEAPAQALLGLSSNAARGRVHQLDLAGGTLPVIVTFPPRFILQAAGKDDLKDRRARIWADLQSFMAI